MTETTRPLQHQGTFYPAADALLQQQLAYYLQERPPINSDRVKALVVPHAGYDYSARIAGQAYAILQQQTGIRRLVVLGPNHQQPTTGARITGHAQWLTPSGCLRVDQAFMATHWETLEFLQVDDLTHQQEYSIEVQLPFIQAALPEVSIVPVLMGECDPDQVAALLRPAWACPETLILISSDLYHYLPREQALTQGMAIIRLLEQNNEQQLTGNHACGYVALRGLMRLAKQYQAYWQTLAVHHSAQDNRLRSDKLVGYAAMALLAREDETL